MNNLMPQTGGEGVKSSDCTIITSSLHVPALKKSALCSVRLPEILPSQFNDRFHIL